MASYCVKLCLEGEEEMFSVITTTALPVYVSQFLVLVKETFKNILSNVDAASLRLFLSDGGAEAKAMELFAEVAHRNSASTADTAFFIRIKKGDFRVTILFFIFRSYLLLKIYKLYFYR